MICETVNNLRKLFTIPDLGQKVREHIKGVKIPCSGADGKTLRLYSIESSRFFDPAFRTRYFIFGISNNFK